MVPGRPPTFSPQERLAALREFERKADLLGWVRFPKAAFLLMACTLVGFEGPKGQGARLHAWLEEAAAVLPIRATVLRALLASSPNAPAPVGEDRSHRCARDGGDGWIVAPLRENGRDLVTDRKRCPACGDVAVVFRFSSMDPQDD